MASLSFLNGAEVDTLDRTIVEPLAAPQTVASKIRDNFPDTLYSHSPNGLLYIFLTTLLGDSGTNSIKKQMLYPRLANNLFNTHFTDLDKFYGNSFGFQRIDEEIYKYDPVTQLLDEDAWQEVRRKDAWYRSRCLDYIQALQYGTTPTGLALLAKAASGIECSIFERWRYLDDQISDEILNVSDLGKTQTRQEFVVVAHTDKLTPFQERRISNMMHRVKPTNTMFTIVTQPKSRLEVVPAGVTATSKYFQIRKLVTGNKQIKYPPVDPSSGLWIEPGVEKEAPTYAFNNRAESVIWPTIFGANATSLHVGAFNQLQRSLFPHLANVPDPLYQFSPTQGYANIPVSMTISQPWIDRLNNQTYVNDSFPLGYFSDPNVPIVTEEKHFWASQEALPPTPESLIVDLQSNRDINYIELEISTKPVVFTINYKDQNDNWVEVNYLDGPLLEQEREVVFSSSSNSWRLVQIPFENVNTRYVKVDFVRKETKFPYNTSPLFEWSIEVRALRVAKVVMDLDDFQGVVDPTDPTILIGDSGLDILGNAYRTVLEPDRYAPEKVIDSDLNSFWQSQANPSRFAVEALYFDIRDQDGNAQTIDEIYIDPITAGCLMHIYWSNDSANLVPPLNQTEDDWKLWTPIPRHYILSKGYHSLKGSIEAKFIKIEFTKLLPSPYKALDVSFRPIRYRTYPSWAQEYIFNFNGNKSDEDSPFSFIETDTVVLDYTNLGILNPDNTKFSDETPVSIEDYQQTATDSYRSLFDDYQTWTKNGIDSINVDKHVGIQIYTSLFSQSIVDTLTTFTFVNRFILADDPTNLFAVEVPLVSKDLLDLASKNDRAPALDEKQYPDMWFPLTARHAYKVLESPRTNEIGFNVAIREIALFRTDHTVAADQEFYIDSFSDDVNIEESDFTRADWRLIVSTSFYGEPTSTEVGVGDEDFDILTVGRQE